MMPTDDRGFPQWEPSPAPRMTPPFEPSRNRLENKVRREGLPLRDRGQTTRHINLTRRSGALPRKQCSFQRRRDDDDNDDDDDDSKEEQEDEEEEEEEEDSTPLAIRPQRMSPWLELDANETNLFVECRLPSDFVRRQLRNSSEHIIGLMSRGTANANLAKSTAMNIMSDVTTHPALLYSSIFATLVIERLLRGDTCPTTLESALGAAAITHLRRVVRDPQDAITDATIVTVIGLAYSGRLAPMRVGSRFPRQSFLRELQYIHIYCKLDVVPEHAMGLQQIIKLLGGIERVKTPGLTAILSFTGVIGSCRSLIRPPFPFVPITGFALKNGRLGITEDEFTAVKSELGRLGIGFRLAFGRALSDGSGDLGVAIQHACDFTVAVENFAHGRYTGRTMPEMMDLRNYAQYCIMSLQPSLDLFQKGITVTDVQYESCRLATVLFSFFVIFPVPPVQGIFETLTRQLMESLLKIKVDALTRSRLKLQLWILSIGAIGSIDLPNRPWFLAKIREILQEENIRNREDFQNLLLSFLWHPRTNHPDMLDVWTELWQGETLDVKQDVAATSKYCILPGPQSDG